MDWITPELVTTLHEMSWFDGIAYIILGLLVYACVKWIRNKWR